MEFSMEWVALSLVLNLVAFCALVMFGLFRLQGKSNSRPATISADSPAPSDEPPKLDWLHKLTTKIDDDLDCHSFRIEQIGAELRDAAGNRTDDVLKAAARILIANRHLQQDLSAAQKEIQRQRQEVASLAAEARTDTLTGLPNRRSFDEDFARRFDQWQRHQIAVSLVMVDIDSFKKFNDSHGHHTGDEVLRLTAQVLKRTLRQMDLTARIGGEEFAVLLPNTRLKDATAVAERLRAAVASEQFRVGGQELRVTASLGLASVLVDEDAETLYKRADAALYAAKNSGRNRAFLHDGTNAIAIARDASVVRQPFSEKQFIAPYCGHGPLPEQEEFQAVQCHDLSAGGLSYLCDEPPDFQKFVVRLGKGLETCYVVARVANVVDIGTPDQPRYRVGCCFVERLGGTKTAAAPAAKAAPIVISDPQTGLLSFSTAPIA
jgi:diguanylate cyclase (GGDEF)-like protein